MADQLTDTPRATGASGPHVPIDRRRFLRTVGLGQIPTASAFGALVTTDPLDPTTRLQAGRLWQRLHLTATDTPS